MTKLPPPPPPVKLPPSRIDRLGELPLWTAILAGFLVAAVVIGIYSLL